MLIGSAGVGPAIGTTDTVLSVGNASVLLRQLAFALTAIAATYLHVGGTQAGTASEEGDIGVADDRPSHAVRLQQTLVLNVMQALYAVRASWVAACIVSHSEHALVNYWFCNSLDLTLLSYASRGEKLLCKGYVLVLLLIHGYCV